MNSGNSLPTSAKPDTARLRETADWLIRLSGDCVEEAELSAWIQWCESDSANAKAFEELQQLWMDFGRLEAHALHTQRSPENTLPSADAAPRITPSPHSMATSLLARLHFTRRSAFTWAAGLATGVLAMWLVFTVKIAAVHIPDGTELTTPFAKNREAVLPDGSVVELGAQSSISLEYAPQLRRLKLANGQAFFHVMKDKTRPFIVEAGFLTVRAVGTAFDVRKNDGRLVVTVTEGAVDIIVDEASARAVAGTPELPMHVAAGYQLTWDNGLATDGRPGKLQLARVDPVSATAWRQGRLEYVDEPLSVVIANVNRYSRHPLVMEGGDLGTLIYTGSIFVDSIDDWLAAVGRAFPLSIEKRQDDVVIIRRRHEPSVAAQNAPR